jgi:hypothetical protein
LQLGRAEQLAMDVKVQAEPQLRTETNKRPDDSAWKQQRLSAWQPLLTPRWVIGIFSMIAIVFIPLGIGIVVSSNQIVEVSMRYDDICPLFNSSSVNYCTFDVNITSTMNPPVYFYYELTNFYQNHRRYVSSRSDPQLSGQGLSASLSSCDPIETRTDSTGQQLVIVPCGLIANSFFNDTFTAAVCSSSSPCHSLSPPYPDDDCPSWQKNGIAWASDVSRKFKYVPLTAGYTNISYEDYALPRVDDEDFIVWMRTAGLPSFRKLYRIISNATLQAGTWVNVNVSNVFPVYQFSGSKSVVISTTAWIGGKNPFLGWAYITVGCLAALLALLFGLKQLTSPRRLGDMQYFHWPSKSKELDSGDE